MQPLYFNFSDKQLSSMHMEIIPIYSRKFSDLYYIKSDSSTFDVIMQLLFNLLTC